MHGGQLPLCQRVALPCKCKLLGVLLCFASIGLGVHVVRGPMVARRLLGSPRTSVGGRPLGSGRGGRGRPARCCSGRGPTRTLRAWAWPRLRLARSCRRGSRGLHPCGTSRLCRTSQGGAAGLLRTRLVASRQTTAAAEARTRPPLNGAAGAPLKAAGGPHRRGTPSRHQRGDGALLAPPLAPTSERRPIRARRGCSANLRGDQDIPVAHEGRHNPGRRRAQSPKPKCLGASHCRGW